MYCDRKQLAIISEEQYYMGKGKYRYPSFLDTESTGATND